MIEIKDISYLPQEVQTFVNNQFNSTDGECYKYLKICRNDNGVGFREIKCEASDERASIFYLQKSKYVAKIITATSGTRSDVYELWFDTSPSPSTRRQLVVNEADAKPVVPGDGPRVTGIKLEGFPVHNSITQLEAMYATCTMDGVYLHGQKLVLRDGAWHKPD